MPQPLSGEWLDAPFRLVVAPHAGVWRPAADLAVLAPVDRGQLIGVVCQGSSFSPVWCLHGGVVVSLPALTGERVRHGQVLLTLSLPA